MPDPINYGALQVQPELLKNFTAGFEVGAAIDQQQKQAALQEQYQADMKRYMQAPTAQGAADFALKYPKLGEAVAKNWATLNSEQQANELKDLGTVSSAFEAGRPDIASSTLQRRIDAQKAAGMDTKPLESLAQIISTDPTQAKARILAYTAAVPGGVDVLKNLASIGGESRADAKLPAEVVKARADAQKAAADANIRAVEAGAAPTTVALQNANTQSQIEDRAAGQRIAELNVQIAQANSETTRGQLTLERDKLMQAQQQKNQEQGASAQDTLDTLNASLETVKSIREHPGIKGFFTGAGTFAGKLSGLIPGTDRKDVEGLIETLKSQQFQTAIKQMVGLGSLSNAEGEKIGSAVATISLDMSPGALKNALGVVETNLNRAQQKLIGAGKLSPTSQTFVAKLPGIGNVTDGMVNKLLQQNPGATREQVMQFLQSQAKPAGGATGGY